MKIDHEDIKKLYEAYIVEKTSEERKDCPSAELIYSLFQLNKSENIRNDTLAHVLKCSHCLKDFQFILTTLREEKKFMNDLEEALDSAEKDNKKAKGTLAYLFHLSWKYSFFLIGAAIITVALIINIPNRNVYRGTNQKSIRLIYPKGQLQIKSKLVFEWEMVENADHFILEIFDESLYPIWKSEKTMINQIVLPNSVLARLDRQKVYYWEVTAFMPNDRILGSRLQKFRLKQ